MKFIPQGKTFKQRMEAFIADVKATYKITVRIDKGRTAEWQQKHHVAHMFLYNSYKSTKPAKVEKDKRTISWAHFSDPSVTWNTIRWEDFLRTKTNEQPVKDGKKWKEGKAPDEEKTIANAKLMQITAGIGSHGKAMVSSGLKPCGEPCKCGAGRSKHLDGVASDANSGDLNLLTQALTKAKAGTLDNYLKGFGLHRPLLNHATSPEKWHIEATK